MRYAILAEIYRKLDATQKRLEMIDILIELFDKTELENIRIVIYLTSGKIGADFEDLDIGIAEKMVIKAIAKAVGKSEEIVTALFAKKGDLGEVVEAFKAKSTQQGLEAFLTDGKTAAEESLTVREVWETLNKIANLEGKGSAAKKINTLVGLYAKATPLEAKYITRTVLSQLRLGVRDLTIIEALARKYCTEKDARKVIEHAYNVTSDIGFVGEILARKGLEAVRQIKIQVGRPIRMMAAQRLPSTEEILEKLGGKCALEFKYDGERVQAHKNGDKITLFSRNLNDISTMYPDVRDALKASITASKAIVEGEIVAWDPQAERLRPFQILMSRKRKYDISEMKEKIPVKVFLFDLLFVDGENYLLKAYPQRRTKLEEIIKEEEIITLASQEIVTNASEFEAFFETAIESGCEGVMAKDIRETAIYQAGNRGFLWIKHKFDYSSAFADSYDFVVVGGFYGKGRRKGMLGTLLMAAYNPEKEIFETVCKLGSGFSDEDLAKITKELMALRTPEKPKEVASKLEADVWFYPTKVFEIRGADLSTSPVHTCALNEIKEDMGIAIRFPRFIRFREDKKPEFATTTKEIIDAYKEQRLLKKEKKN